MRVKTLLIATAIVSAILGAIVAYLVLTVPNDIQSGAMLKNARKEIAAGHNDRARAELTRIVQQYPRTDAAAAAIAALTSIANHERQAIEASIQQVRRDAAAQKAQLADLQKKVAVLAAAPPPTPPPPPAPVVKKAPPPAKKKAPVKRPRR
ncbi:MAG: hypothetical protein AABO58_15815 [Acidobacteriota bacterium]